MSETLTEIFPQRLNYICGCVGLREKKKKRLYITDNKRTPILRNSNVHVQKYMRARVTAAERERCH